METFSHELLLYFFFKFRSRRKDIKRRICGKETHESGLCSPTQFWHVLCSFSAHMGLFLDVCAKKRIRALGTVHLTLPPIMLHLSLCSGFLAVLCMMDPKDVYDDTRNTCVLDVWVIVRTWTMTEGAATSITLCTCVDESWQSWVLHGYCYPEKDSFHFGFKRRPSITFTCPNNDKSLTSLSSFLLSLRTVRWRLHGRSKLWRILDKTSF